MWSASRLNSWPFVFFMCVIEAKQAVSSNVLQYTDDSCLAFQYKDVTKIGTSLNNNFSGLCEWFLDKKLSIQSGEDESKSILFETKCNIKKSGKLNITYQVIGIK